MNKRLYIQLYNANTGESITLPLNPESTDIPNEKDIKTYNILDYGEVSIRGNRQLKRITLSNILPENNSYFAILASLVKQLNFKTYSVSETVEMLNRWVDNDNVIRVIISGHLNGEFTIARFIEQVKESTGNIGYTIDLVEYRDPNRKTAPIEAPKSNLTKLKERAIKKYVPNQKVATAGTTIYKLAKLTYGGNSNALAKLNSISDRNADLTGKVIEMLPIDKMVKE